MTSRNHASMRWAGTMYPINSIPESESGHLNGAGSKLSWCGRQKVFVKVSRGKTDLSSPLKEFHSPLRRNPRIILSQPPHVWLGFSETRFVIACQPLMSSLSLLHIVSHYNRSRLEPTLSSYACIVLTHNTYSPRHSPCSRHIPSPQHSPQSSSFSYRTLHTSISASPLLPLLSPGICNPSLKRKQMYLMSKSIVFMSFARGITAKKKQRNLQPRSFITHLNC